MGVIVVGVLRRRLQHVDVQANPKAALRSRYRQVRQQQPGGAALVEALVGALTQELAPLRRAGAIGLYWPLSGEPDLRPLTEQVALQSCAWALPAVLAPAATAAAPANQAQLHYLPWQPGERLQPDACGIPAPACATGTHRSPLDPEQLALLLVPALAVDRDGIRLGYGGGWYDRLRAQPAWRRCLSLVVLPAACVCRSSLPRDPWDVPFDGWIDEHGLHRC